MTLTPQEKKVLVERPFAWLQLVLMVIIALPLMALALTPHTSTAVATSPNAVQYVPFAWGFNQAPIVIGSMETTYAASEAGGFLYDGQSISFGSPNFDYFADPAAGKMLRAGTLNSVVLRAFGPYDTSGSPVAASTDPSATLTIELQKNGAAIASLTWTAGEDAIKTYAIPSGSVSFASTDTLGLKADITSTDAWPGANIYNALLGITWS